MTVKHKYKSKARDLQQLTGWTYSECLRLVRLVIDGNMTIDAVLAKEGRTRTPRVP